MAGKVMEYLDTMLNEKMWSGDVKTKWHPKEGFFDQSAEKIAAVLKRNSKDAKQAMSRLNFYINRAGKNLSPADKARLENAKKKLESVNESVGEVEKTVTLLHDVHGGEPHTKGKLIYKKGAKVKVSPASNLPDYQKKNLFWVNDPKEPEGGAGTLLVAGEDFKECVELADSMILTESADLEKALETVIGKHTLPEVVAAIANVCEGKVKNMEKTSDDDLWNWSKAAQLLNETSNKLVQLDL